MISSNQWLTNRTIANDALANSDSLPMLTSSDEKCLASDWRDIQRSSVINTHLGEPRVRNQISFPASQVRVKLPRQFEAFSGEFRKHLKLVEIQDAPDLFQFEIEFELRFTESLANHFELRQLVAIQ